MPNMANIVVKKADGTTDITYTAMQPSSGDGTAAVWRSETAGASAGHKPIVSLTSRWNGQKTARRLELEASYPQTSTNTTTSLTSVVNKLPLTLSIAVPADMPDTVVNEAVAQLLNLAASSLIKSSIASGYAPT